MFQTVTGDGICTGMENNDLCELIPLLFQIEAGDGVGAAMEQLQQDNVSDCVSFLLSVQRSVK